MKMDTQYLQELVSIIDELTKLRDEVHENKIQSGPERERVAKRQRELAERLRTLKPD